MSGRSDRILSLGLTGAWILALAGAASAQDRTPLDPGVSDINSLQTSLRAVPPAGGRFHIGPPLGFGDGPIDPATAALLRQTNPEFDLRAVDRDRNDAVTDRTTTVVRMPAPVPTISSEAVRQQRLREITAKALHKAGLDG